LGFPTGLHTNSPEPEEVMMVKVIWMQPYLAYMLNKMLTKDVVEAWRIMQQSKAFVVVKELYKKNMGFCKDVSHLKRDGQYYTTSTQEYAVMMPVVEP
jgi:hypothetical protein